MKPLKKTLSGVALTTLLASPAAFAETLSVAEVHEQRQALSGEQVSVSGEVVKVNNGIMRRNFVHVEDGTGSGDNGRLILTSQDTAQVGDQVTATGTIKLDTDFGMGYFYPTLVEEASITAQ